jgi:hypothetical protein
MSKTLRKQAAYDQQNAQAAAIILADSTKYGGERSLKVRWARAVQTGQRSRTEPQGDLFDTEVA